MSILSFALAPFLLLLLLGLGLGVLTSLFLE